MGGNCKIIDAVDKCNVVASLPKKTLLLELRKVNVRKSITNENKIIQTEKNTYMRRHYEVMCGIRKRI